MTQKERNLNEVIGMIIRDLRKERGLSQTELGEILFTGQDTISLWERGKRLPDVKSLVAMSKFFEVSLDELVGLK